MSLEELVQEKLGTPTAVANPFANMAVAEDSLYAPKTSVRGSVWEAYLTHRIARRFILKLDYMRYDFSHSGSGWHMGAPKDLDTTPILGFASPTDADRFLLGLQARF